jgi:hypothetical protein
MSMKTIPIVMISAVMPYIMFSQRKTQKIKIKGAKQHEKLMSCDQYMLMWLSNSFKKTIIPSNISI